MALAQPLDNAIGGIFIHNSAQTHFRFYRSLRAFIALVKVYQIIFSCIFSDGIKKLSVTQVLKLSGFCSFDVS